MVIELIKQLLTQPKKLFKAILSLAVAFLLFFGISTYKKNKMLSERLEMANNNIEAYLGVINDSQLANNVLQLKVEDLQQYNDALLNRIDSVKNELKIKDKQIKTAATQTLIIYVKDSKGVGGLLTEILRDTTYSDSIKYNPLTTVYYTIGNDTVSIALDVRNTQYLYVYNTKEWKNKKNFLQRLFTLDFKKVTKTKYVIDNTNDLLKTEDVRVVEIK